MLSKLKAIVVAITLAIIWILHLIGMRRSKKEGRKEEKVEQILRSDGKRKKMRKARTIRTNDECHDELRKGTF